MNKLLKSLLKTAVYLMDQFSEQVDRASDRASDRVSDLTDRPRIVNDHEENHTLRNVATFAAGVGVGIGAGILFAPASGKEIRNSISEKVQDISDQVRERVAPAELRPRPTGTEPL
jgi:YtxH-like protein